MKRKTVKSAPKKRKVTEDIFKKKAHVLIDLGCGENKRPNTIGVDMRAMKGVDIVQDLSMFPWSAIPDGVADVA